MEEEKKEPIFCRLRNSGRCFANDLGALSCALRSIPFCMEAETSSSILSMEASFDLSEKLLPSKYPPAGLQFCITPTLDGALRVADSTNNNLLISGYTGVGKEVLARAIYSRLGYRWEELPVFHCQGLLQTKIGECQHCSNCRLTKLLEQEPPIILLDEIGDLGADCLESVVSALQAQGTIRVLVTTNRPTAALLGNGGLPHHIHRWLAAMDIHLPPLRERTAEIPQLLSWFVQRACADLGIEVRSIEPEVFRTALRHSWPGNERELRNTVYRAVSYVADGVLSRLPIPTNSAAPAGQLSHSLPGAKPPCDRTQFSE